MSTKTLLIILVLIAIVVGVAIWRGQRDEGEVNRKENREHPPGENFFVFKWLAGGGDTLAIARLVGCGRDGRILRFGGTCTARILPGEARQSRFVLKAFTGSVRACYGFTMGQLVECHGTDLEEKSLVKPDGKSRFVVSKDSAFLRLYCQLSSGCTVTVE